VIRRRIQPKPARPTACLEIARVLDRLLQTSAIPDSSLNGLQVEGKRPVRVVAAAVDASLETFRLARQADADLLLVHHGLFWGKAEPVVGPLYSRLAVLMESGMGLYASHLPLDLHPRMGNNALLAQGLEMTRLQPFGTYHGQKIGFGGRLPRPLTLNQLSLKLSRITGAPVRSLAFGPRLVQRVAVVSGGAGDLVQEAAREAYDAFVTGELVHQNYHACREAEIHFVAGGHYATEMLGVKAAARYLENEYKIRSVFIDFPTDL